MNETGGKPTAKGIRSDGPPVPSEPCKDAARTWQVEP
jgi:hypothetical protein